MHVPHAFPSQRLSPWIHQEGVLWHEPSQCDLLFVTLNKSEALFSPSTRYRDLALGPSLFTLGEPDHHHHHRLPYRLSGFARYESHEGERSLGLAV